MRITIDIDCTAEEARTFLGLPDVEPVNQLIVDEVMERAKENLDTLADPERFMAEMMNFGTKGMAQFQAMMAQAMAGKK